MSGLLVTCRQCRAEFEPDHDAIVAGSWRTCPTCQLSVPSEQSASPSRCEGCGRVLRAAARSLCHSCLTGGTGL